MAPALRRLKTPLSSVSAWLSRVTLADHFLFVAMARERPAPVQVAAATHIPQASFFRMECGMAVKGRILKAKVDDKLDRALEDSFPASDPVSFLEPVPARPRRRKAKATRREEPDESRRA